MGRNEIHETLLAVEEGLDVDRLLRRWQRHMQQKLPGVVKPALDMLTREPGPPIYPLRWQTLKQKRAFFATNGFGHGIPYQRKGTLLEGWDWLFEPRKDGGEVALTNPSKVLEFAQGDRAQRFHLDTGWVQIADAEPDFYGPVEALAVDEWRNVALYPEEMA